MLRQIYTQEVSEIIPNLLLLISCVTWVYYSSHGCQAPLLGAATPLSPVVLPSPPPRTLGAWLENWSKNPLDRGKTFSIWGRGRVITQQVQYLCRTLIMADIGKIGFVHHFNCLFSNKTLQYSVANKPNVLVKYLKIILTHGSWLIC